MLPYQGMKLCVNVSICNAVGEMGSADVNRLG